MEKISGILDLIRKPFGLEKEKEYSNRSVIKGFDRFIISHCIDASKEIELLDEKQEIKMYLKSLFEKLKNIFNKYPVSDKQGRQDIFEEAQRILAEIDKFILDPIPPQEHNFRDLRSSVQYLHGVGPKRAKILESIDITSIFDLISYYPFRYEDRSRLKLIAQIVDGEEATIQALIVKQRIARTRRGPLLTLLISDGTSEALVVCFNQFYLKNILNEGKAIVLNGRFKRKTLKNGRSARPEISNFTYEVLTKDEEDLIHTNRIVPIYNITKNLNMRFLRALIKHTIDDYGSAFREILDKELKKRQDLCDYSFALKNIHFPKDLQAQSLARERLVFDEFFLLELSFAVARAKNKKLTGITFKIPEGFVENFEKNLPFKFTTSQKKVISEIIQDMQDVKPMNRLLQGDVGCGKTIVALLAAYLAAENGYQTAFMAPTEILAGQHFININNYLKQFGIRSGLLISGTAPKEKKKILGSLRSGEIDLIIGTHALIEDNVDFKKLGLIIIDEQHKFGVLQRMKLRSKGVDPDVLVMTATPIPRTLALTCYGDLDFSVIDELPPGRKKVTTVFYKEKDRQEAQELLKKEISSGRQAYIVYPLVEESEKIDLKAATEEFEKLKKIYPGSRLGLIHGRLSSAEKEKIMFDFKDKKLDILVATTVIEVGIDVPNASIMLIEHSERFGLSQLHQLRGRVGRGANESFCILLAGIKISNEAKKRIRIFEKTNDGFKIAEEDLQLRGPGEFMGTRQHGISFFKIADIIKDSQVLFRARNEAFDLVKIDPGLSEQKNKLLKETMLMTYKDKQDLSKIG